MMRKLLSILLCVSLFAALIPEIKAQDNLTVLTTDSLDAQSQDSLRFYINAGYITNLKKCSECTRADAGGSIRIGLLIKGRFGYYIGYLWFDEFHPSYADYDDSGYGFVAGIDFLILRRNEFRWYVNAGLFIEKYKSTYRNSSRIEIETSPKPDFGALFNYKHLNASLGWQPSDPSHINLGIGYTF